jgi:hypothetical protein
MGGVTDACPTFASLPERRSADPGEAGIGSAAAEPDSSVTLERGDEPPSAAEDSPSPPQPAVRRAMDRRRTADAARVVNMRL